MRLIVVAALASSAFAWTPTQADLDAAVKTAEGLWGIHAEVAGIRFADVGPCVDGSRYYLAWSELGPRVIDINPRCQWDRTTLNLVVVHEYGHMLAGAAHSLDRRSVMFFSPKIGQRILAEDRENVSK